MPRVVRQLGIATAICAVLGSSPARIQAQSVDQTFKSSVDLVTIQASVRDRRGRPVAGLTPRDFEVRDNGELRPVISVRADDRSSLSLAVLVDMSGSMSFGPKVEMARHAFDTLLAQLRTGDDELESSLLIRRFINGTPSARTSRRSRTPSTISSPTARRRCSTRQQRSHANLPGVRQHARPWS